MKPASELTDLEAEKELTELLGGCWHDDKGSGPNGSFWSYCSKCPIEYARLDTEDEYPFKEYATSYDAIIPVIQEMTDYSIAVERTMRENHPAIAKVRSCWMLLFEPRELLNVAIEVLRQNKTAFCKHEFHRIKTVSGSDYKICRHCSAEMICPTTP